MHMTTKNDVYENMGWMCNLRNDRANVKLAPFVHSDQKFVNKELKKKQ